MSSVRRRLRSALPALSAFIAACDPLGLGTADIEGTWLLSARNLTAPQISCQITALELHIRQDGERFTGTTSGGELDCLRDNLPAVTRLLTTEPIVSGRLIGDSVIFQIGNADWTHAGRIQHRSMTGSIEVLFGPPIGSSVLTGRFGAAKTDSSASR
jgi:hypothetical protein